MSTEESSGTDRSLLLSTPECTVSSAHEGDTVRVWITGEVDLANADDVSAVLQPLVTSGATRVEILLGGLEFIDSFGISRLIMAQQTALEEGVKLSLREVRPGTHRVLLVSGLLTYLDVG